jgi:isoleucyl-tRNA synthetase
MSAQGLRTQAMQAVQEVHWFPHWGKARIESMLLNRPDWCISRQRTWGVPLPLLVHATSGALHPELQAIIEHVAQQVEQDGIEAWFKLDLSQLPFSVEGYQKTQDTLDVWFDSGVSHACVANKDMLLQQPADLYWEGSDQHRGWFQSSLLTALGMYGVPPYRNVLTHGFTVDAKGRKMSKSLGNVINPNKVIEKLGADVLRLWVAATDYRSEVPVSEEILSRTAEAYRRLRNTARFLLANLNGFDPAQHKVADDQLLALDAWVIARTEQLQAQIIEAYAQYQFHHVYQLMHHFCINELGRFYLDVIKDRQYTAKRGSIPQRSTQTAMYHIIQALVRWMAPILSFTAEDIWQHLPGERAVSVMVAEWYTDFPLVRTYPHMRAEFWSTVMAVRDEVNQGLEQLRRQGEIGAPLAAEVILYAAPDLYQLLGQLADEVRFLLITSKATLQLLQAAPETAQATQLAELKLSITPSTAPKCVRCWHRRDEVDQHPSYPGLCERCVSNVAPDSAGEVRYYA